MTMLLPPQDAAAQLSAVAAELAAALAQEETAPLTPVMLLDRACDLLDALSWAMCREPASFPLGGLREIARSLAAELSPGPQEPGDDGTLGIQAQAVGAQAGELTDAYCLWAARGRRPGPCRDLVAGEVATMLLTTAVFAEMAGIDIDKAIGAQVTVTRLPGDGQSAEEAGSGAGQAAVLAAAGPGKR